MRGVLELILGWICIALGVLFIAATCGALSTRVGLGYVVMSLICAAVFFAIGCKIVYHALDLIDSLEIVPQKHLTANTYWGTVNVEVFDLIEHPKAYTVYAWTNETDDAANPKHHVTVLHLGPVKSAADAVRAAIVQEFRSLETTEEA